MPTSPARRTVARRRLPSVSIDTHSPLSLGRLVTGLRICWKVSRSIWAFFINPSGSLANLPTNFMMSGAVFLRLWWVVKGGWRHVTKAGYFLVSYCCTLFDDIYICCRIDKHYIKARTFMRGVSWQSLPLMGTFTVAVKIVYIPYCAGTHSPRILREMQNRGCPSILVIIPYIHVRDLPPEVTPLGFVDYSQECFCGRNDAHARCTYITTCEFDVPSLSSEPLDELLTDDTDWSSLWHSFLSRQGSLVVLKNCLLRSSKLVAFIWFCVMFVFFVSLRPFACINFHS